MKQLTLTLALLATLPIFAKKVKFAVDMTGITINTTGVHVAGDFQAVAGFENGDWQANTTPLTQEVGDTNIYSIVVDIPAFAKYEYKFLNGDQFYDVEFVPVESRVGYNFSDNRWLYVDSLANDTTFVGAIRFGQNAPAGLKLIRFMVDLQSESGVSPDGVHLATSFSGNDAMQNYLWSFEGTVSEGILYADSNATYSYRFYNGSAEATAENVPSACATDGYRTIALVDHIVLPLVCFSACDSCTTTGISSIEKETVLVAPNPAQNTLKVSGIGAYASARLVDISGRQLLQWNSLTSPSIEVSKDQVGSGIFFLQLSNEKGNSSTQKIIFTQ